MAEARREVFELGDISLQCGKVLENARIVYRTYGTLNSAGDNAIVFPTYYSGVDTDNEWLIGQGKALDPESFFIVVPNMFGNGVSTSPSHLPIGSRGDFPLVTVRDNVRQQHRLLTEELGVKEIALAIGWSMGGQQAYHWASMYPQMVLRIAPICSSARTSIHNRVFLKGLVAALTAYPGWGDATESVARHSPGIRAFGHVYAGWVCSQGWWREQLYRVAGAPTPEAYMDGMAARFGLLNPHDLLAMIDTWVHADISDDDCHGGDLKRALGAITARALVMPAKTDLYFTPEDSEGEVARLPNARLVVIPTIWGHVAGSGANPEDARFIDSEIARFLSDS